MTPFSLSEPFYTRLQCKKRCVILEGAGHFPIEHPGVEQMKSAILDFLNEIAKDVTNLTNKFSRFFSIGVKK